MVLGQPKYKKGDKCMYKQGGAYEERLVTIIGVKRGFADIHMIHYDVEEMNDTYPGEVRLRLLCDTECAPCKSSCKADKRCEFYEE